MFSGGCSSQDVADVPALEHHSVGDEGAVTAPGHGFSAHDHGGSCAGYFDEGGEAFGELRRCHIVRIAAKRCVAPTGVDGVFAGVAATAESFQMREFDIGGAK